MASRKYWQCIPRFLSNCQCLGSPQNHRQFLNPQESETLQKYVTETNEFQSFLLRTHGHDIPQKLFFSSVKTIQISILVVLYIKDSRVTLVYSYTLSVTHFWFVFSDCTIEYIKKGRTNNICSTIIIFHRCFPEKNSSFLFL